MDGDNSRGRDISNDGHHTYEIDPGDPYSTAVVDAVADAIGCDALELPERLHDATAVDALDQLFLPATTRTSTDPNVSFTYCGYLVTVAPSSIELTPEDGSRFR